MIAGAPNSHTGRYLGPLLGVLAEAGDGLER
jgi:hypothetical protein